MVYDTSQQMMKSVGFSRETSLKYSVLRGSFFEKSDSLKQKQRFEGIGMWTRAGPGRTQGLRA